LGLPGFLDVSLPACHGLMTPAAFHIFAINRCFLLPSSALKLSAITTTFRSCASTSGSAVSPTAYWILCVRLPHLLFAVTCSAMRSTLDTGGWLTLARQGLSPRKIRRASPSAITLAAEEKCELTSILSCCLHLLTLASHNIECSRFTNVKTVGNKERLNL